MVWSSLVAIFVLAALLTFARGFPYSPENTSAKIIFAAWIAVWSLIYAATWRDAIKQSQGGFSRRALVIFVFVVSMTVGITNWLDLTLGGSLINDDFTQDYLPAYALRHGMDIYGPSLDTLSVSLFKFVAKNYHPPFDALFFVPLTFLPYRAAFVIWNLISLIGFALLIVYLLEACALASYPWLPLSAVLLLWPPFTATLWLGQTSVLLALLIVFGYASLTARRDILAGCLFGLATLIKLFPGFLLLYVVVRRRWRCAVSFTATVAVGLLMTFVVVGIENWLYYLELIVPEQTRLFASLPFNISIEGIARLFFGPNLYYAPAHLLSSDIVRGLIWLVNGSLIIAAWCAGWFCREPQKNQDVFGLFCITMLLVSPLTWPHTCLMLLFPMSLLLRDALLHERLGDLRVLFIVLVLFAVPSSVVLASLDQSYAPKDPPWYFLLTAKSGFFALLLLWVTFWLRVRNQSRASDPQ